MKSPLKSLLLASVLGLALPVAAAENSHGEVRKIDKPHAKITLQHGGIKSLDMPPMTMAFVVRNKAVLDTVKVGDKVSFVATKDGGTYTVTEIRVVP